MIKQITVESFHDIDPLLDDLVRVRQDTPNALSESVKDDILDWISKGDAEVFALFREGHAVGFVMNYPVSKKIGIIHVDSSITEIDAIRGRLFDEAFENLSQKTDVIRTGGGSLDSTAESYIISKGFKKYVRRSMKLDRTKIKLLPKPELPEGFKFGAYNPAMRRDVADLIYRANMGHQEAITFPDFFGSIEVTNQFLESIEEMLFYPFSKVILHDEEPVGLCLIIFNSEDRGHIAEVCIHKDYRRKGLARNLLIYAFNHSLLEMEQMETITLDVTEGNPARDLYLELGFEDVDEYPLYTWSK